MNFFPPMNARGQLFSTDLLFAVSVFLFALTFSIVFSNQLAVRVESIEAFNHQQDLARNAMNVLLTSPGYPGHWQALPDLSTVDGLGLASSRNQLVPAKVLAFMDLNASAYADMKALLGLSRYDFEFSVNDLNGSTLALVGTSPDANSTTASINRLALYQGREVIVRLRVFD
ncbi:MAG TPA: hypothetical protein HA252_03515 [Candidatus Diapherotrites archaeon]|uniref:Uncharacterized protein n=1 Tax=Candidatus Iainarchaeum sp. TaxID=3101447 RepID=A0A7J4JMH9_9ARCH|nr:hypothetical protein [Candidatus Diapherotrites archaeon]HIH16446.1 hypothetical protein [Candidatus Diapherotrites archaeon]